MRIPVSIPLRWNEEEGYALKSKAEVDCLLERLLAVKRRHTGVATFLILAFPLVPKVRKEYTKSKTNMAKDKPNRVLAIQEYKYRITVQETDARALRFLTVLSVTQEK